LSRRIHTSSIYFSDRAGYDRAWLDYQQEIAVRHTRAKKNRTDNVDSAADQVANCDLKPALEITDCDLKIWSRPSAI